MGIIGEARAIPQSWDEYLLGLLGRPFNAAADFSKRMQSQDWSDPIGALINTPYAIAQSFTERPGQALEEASQGMPLTRDAGGFPPDSPLSFLNSGLNERASGVIDGLLMAAPVAGRVVRATRELPGIIGDAAVDAYGPRRAASWMFLTEDAPGADLAALERAKALEAQGATPEEIWQATTTPSRLGWFRAPWDQRWRYEVNDANARLRRGPKGGGPLSRYFDHPELYGEDPSLADIPVRPGTMPEGNAAYVVDPLLGGSIKTADRMSIDQMGHEVEHAVQHQNGLAFGGAPERIWGDPQTAGHATLEASRIWDDAVARLLSDPSGKGANFLANLSDQQKAAIAQETRRMAANNVYLKLGGEAEGRLVGDRMAMTFDQRAQSFPLTQMQQMLQGEGVEGGIEGLIPRFIQQPNLTQANAGGEAAMSIAPPARGWKVGTQKPGEFEAPLLTEGLLAGKPISEEAISQFKAAGKAAGVDQGWLDQGAARLGEYNKTFAVPTTEQASAGDAVHDFIDNEVVMRIGVLNTPALSGERFSRVRQVMEAIQRGDKTVTVSKYGATMPNETVTITIPKSIRGANVHEFYNVPSTDPALRKPKPPDFNYPIVITGNPHLQNWVRPDPSWDSVITTVRVKPVLAGNEKVDNAVASAINYAHEIGAKPLVTTFRSKSLWALAKESDVVPMEPKAAEFGKYWKKNPKPPPEDPRRRPDYSPYLPTAATREAFRAAGWDTGANIYGHGGTWWWPRSKELSDGILTKLDDPKGPIEYCDLLGKGCTSCRNCAKTTHPKVPESRIVGCTDEPFCSMGCPQCFVRGGMSGVEGRGEISLKANAKQSGFGQADLGDQFKGSINALQGVARNQQAPVNYLAQFLSMDPAAQADLAASLYAGGLLDDAGMRTLMEEIRKAGR